MAPQPSIVRLGAHYDGHGVSFSLASHNATAVDLCLFRSLSDPMETRRVSLAASSNGVWQTNVEGVGIGQLYGYRVRGPYAPRAGQRFNPNKLLVDPYARLLVGEFQWHGAVHGHLPGDQDGEPSFDPRDSAPYVPRCVVVDSTFDWQRDQAPRTPWSETVIYECHVKGMTALHPNVPPELRGTFLGLSSPPVIDHLHHLGVTAVELLPVHHSLSAKHLAAKGLVNYWGYDTIGFFAPDPRFATRPETAIQEFKTMVREFHRAGLEVILDVVYNHTFEGDQTGPTLCWRGIDNPSYYHLRPDDLRAYQNFTGCGNSLNASHPLCRRMILDSLRYWVEEMHVDGFRFDLATTLTRTHDGLPGAPSLFEEISTDPVLSGVKLIAEPWDVGPDGYRLGGWPPDWAEWNDRYRDSIRRFWRGNSGGAAEFATRLTGSSDLFDPSRRKPWCSVNFVTSHDGFTLRDLVSYTHKHNHANAEDNRDGADQNHSLNFGVEGDTDRPEVLLLRRRLQRSLLATLGLSLGTPMFCAGDELQRTQRGNNNAYGQDNEISWLDWEGMGPGDAQVGSRHEGTDFMRYILQLRHAIGMNSNHFFRGEASSGAAPKDVVWLTADGAEMSHSNWHDPHHKTLAMLLHAPTKEPIASDSRFPAAATWYVAFNAHGESRRFHLPQLGSPGRWLRVLHTAFRRQRVRPLRSFLLSVRAHSVFVAHWLGG